MAIIKIKDFIRENLTNMFTHKQLGYTILPSLSVATVGFDGALSSLCLLRDYILQELQVIKRPKSQTIFIIKTN